MTRRIHALIFTIALMAAPLVFLAGGYNCAEQECAMSCCRAHAMAPKRCHPSEAGTADCAKLCTDRHSRSNLFYVAASPLAPAQVPQSATIPLPAKERHGVASVDAGIMTLYFADPFHPPRV